MERESQPYRGARRSIPICTSLNLSVPRGGNETESQAQRKSRSKYTLGEPMLMGVVSTKIEGAVYGLKLGSPETRVSIRV